MESSLGTNCWKQRCWGHEATQTIRWVTSWDTNGPNVISSHLEFTKTGSRCKKAFCRRTRWSCSFLKYWFIFIHRLNDQVWTDALKMATNSLSPDHVCSSFYFVAYWLKKKKKNKVERKKGRAEIEDCLPLVTYTPTHTHTHKPTQTLCFLSSALIKVTLKFSHSSAAKRSRQLATKWNFQIKFLLSSICLRVEVWDLVCGATGLCRRLAPHIV